MDTKNPLTSTPNRCETVQKNNVVFHHLFEAFGPSWDLFWREVGRQHGAQTDKQKNSRNNEILKASCDPQILEQSWIREAVMDPSWSERRTGN